MITYALTRGLLLGLLLIGDVPDSPQLRSRAEEFAAAFRDAQLERAMALWSPDAPSAPADRRRLSWLIEHRSALDLTITDVVEVGARGLVQLEFRRSKTPLIGLEKFTLEFKLEDGQWRVWSLTSSEAEFAHQLLQATPEQRQLLLKERPPTVALALELLHSGTEFIDAGEIEKSIPVLTLGTELAERTGDGLTQSFGLRALGRLTAIRGDLPAAIVHFENSLKVSESSGYRRGVGKALLILGDLHQTMGDYAQADSRWKAALDIYLQDGDKVGAAFALNNLGVLHSMRGDYPGATSYLQQALTIGQEIDHTVSRAIALANLANVARVQGDYRQALEHAQTALELGRAVNDLYVIFTSFAETSIILTAQGNYLKALEVLQEGLVLAERLGNTDSVAFFLSGIARIYTTLGDYAQAREYLQRSYALAEKLGFKRGMAAIQREIGQLLAQQGDAHGALEYYQKSLAIETELGSGSELAGNLQDLGKAQALLGRKNEARSSYQKSLEFAQKINDRETMLLVLVSLAELAEQPAEYEWGLDFAQQAMTIATEMGLAERLWETHLVLGRLYRRMGRLDEARTEIQQAITTVEEIRSEIPGEEMAQRAFESMVLPYHEMVRILVARGDPAAALEYAERAKARVLLDVLNQGRSDVISAMTNAERSRDRELLASLAQLNRELHEQLMQSKPDSDRVAGLRSKLQKARLDHEAFLTGLYIAHPQLRVARGEVSPIRSVELDELLQQGADALLEFVVSDEATYLFVLSRDQSSGKPDLRVYTLNLNRHQLQNEVSKFRELLAGRDLTYAPAARSLFNKLLRPVEPQLGRAKLICIIPDGPLWELPFQALQPSAGRFLLDRHAIFFAPSLTVLRETLARKKARPEGRSARLLAFGNPVIPAEVVSRVQTVYRDASLAPIPQTETEIRKIASLYGSQNSRVHVREEAREELVKAEAEQFNILHFATHGILDDQSPLYSRLLFSRPSSTAEDGVLEAREIMRLDLDADLVVLSACETGRGRVGAGEGLIGISWAFFVAGCPTSVVSQWKVGSASTTELMIEFHRELRSSNGAARTRAEALRRAALALRAKPAYRHPFNWAPFVLIGDGH